MMSIETRNFKAKIHFKSINGAIIPFESTLGHAYNYFFKSAPSFSLRLARRDGF